MRHSVGWQLCKRLYADYRTYSKLIDNEFMYNRGVDVIINQLANHQTTYEHSYQIKNQIKIKFIYS